MQSRTPLDDLTPPADPRGGWDLPSFGDLPVVAPLGDLVTRVLAPNPSPMTLDGTNTYVLASPGSGAAIVLDPGPDDPGHRDRVEGVLAGLDAACALVAVTHHHVDHAEAARTWADHFGCALAATTPTVAGPTGRVLRDGDVVEVAGLRLDAVATPGHCADHVAFRDPTGALLTGDHVLGRGTSVVAHPDGDLEAYLASLRRILDLGSHRLLPGHGPTLDADPAAVIEYYLAHRAFRQQQILSVLAAGPATVATLVATIYADVDRALLPAAEASTRAALAKLAAEGQVRVDADDHVQRAG